MAAVNVTSEWSLDDEKIPAVIAGALEEHYHIKASRIATAFTFTIKGYGSYVHEAYRVHGADTQAFRDMATDYHVLAEMLAKLVVRLENANTALDEAWSGSAVYAFDEKLGGQVATLKELAQNLEFVSQATRQYADAMFMVNQQWHYAPDTKFVYR